MTVLSDKWIRKMSKEKGMISPFEEKQVRGDSISYGLSSYGYDARVSEEFKIFTNVNSDPAALVYKSYNESIEEKIDVLLIDTAGRLHNKSNLMDELSKIIRVMKKIDEKLPQEIVLGLDGNSGQNSLKQVEKCNEVTSLSGTIITKLDGSAKGGFIVSISKKFKTPIFFIGVGESEDDLIDFNAKEFSKALLSL